MGININISGLKMSGNAEVLNNMKVSGKSNVNIGVRDSKIQGNAKALNNLEVKDGEIKVDIRDVDIGKDVEFMNDKKVKGKNSKSSSKHFTKKEEHRRFVKEMSQNGRFRDIDTEKILQEMKDKENDTEIEKEEYENE